MHEDGDVCSADHFYPASNVRAPQCVWEDGRWSRTDGLKPCPF